MGNEAREDFDERSKPEESEQPENNYEEAIRGEEEIEIVTISGEEMEMLNTQLDELHSALDYLEMRNEYIQARLKDILKDSREYREAIQEKS